MRRRFLGLAVMAVIPLVGVACSSSHSNAAKANDAAPVATPAPAPATTEAAVIESAAFGQDADGARIVLNSDSPLLYTSYEPKPDTLVIDLTGARPADAFTAPAVAGDLVSAVKVEPMTELGRLLTRVSITHRPGLKFEISSQGRSLAIGFDEESTAQTASNSESPAAVTASEIQAESALPSPAPAQTAVPDQAPPSQPTGELARNLENVEVSPAAGGATVVLLGDGVFRASDFVLANPPRIVLDLAGVRSVMKNKVIRGAGPVLRARVSQFRTSPDRVARVVLDLDQARPYKVQRDGERLVLHLGAETAAATSPAAAPPEAPRAEEASRPPSRTVLPEENVAPPSPAAESAAAVVPERPVEAPKPGPAATAAAPASPNDSPKSVVRADQLAGTTTAAAAISIPPEKRAKGVLEARRSPRPPTKAATVKTDKDVLFESAEAMLAQQETPGDRQELANTYKSKTVGGGESQYTGEPISLDLKDADIKDVFRTISELTGLNIVIDPDVKGTVTVRLENVPWDQALELILHQNGLGYILENNVMRIATTQKLQQEESQRAELEKARQGSLPTRTVIKKLSYATAGDAAETVKKVMSPRGDIIVDRRTNTLIIKEIQDFMPTVIQLIENLDTPTPQVVIESRIIETTKTFGRSLGINWGFTGAADAAHGNTTNLVFPNSVNTIGAVGLGTAAPNTLSLVLGNVLDTLNLDVVLTAAENQGLLKIISSPKVSAMTNERAYVQTGLQIPVQTVVNNTTTVIYIDATLRLDVTPQITAEGTVLMNVHIQKRQPAPGVQIQGGGNVPLSIREAQTKLIVKDGGTAVIGGIFQMNDQDSYNFVPGLWKIPILGSLFKNSTRTDEHDELLIFITPRIIH